MGHDHPGCDRLVTPFYLFVDLRRARRGLHRAGRIPGAIYGQDPTYLTERFRPRSARPRPPSAIIRARSGRVHRVRCSPWFAATQPLGFSGPMLVSDRRRRPGVRRHLAVRSQGARNWCRSSPFRGGRGSHPAGHDHRTERCARQRAAVRMSRLGQKTEVAPLKWEVRFTLRRSGHRHAAAACPFRQGLPKVT